MIAFYLENKNEFAPAARHIFYTLGKMIGMEFHEIDSPEIADYPVVVVYGEKFRKTAAKAFYIKQVPYDKVQKNISTDSALQLDIGLFEFAENLSPDKNSPRTDFFSMKRNGIYCMVDIIAGMLFFLTLENERQTDKRDDFNRFQRDYSPLDDAIYDVPIVDRMAKFFRDMLLILAPNLRGQFQPLWPEQKKFALALTHDVDRIRAWTISKAKRYLKQPKPLMLKAAQITHSAMLHANWSGNFRTISKIEKKYSACSTFFFVSRHRHEKDPRYSLHSPRLFFGLNGIVKAGSNIGLHGTIPAAIDSDFLLEEKKRLSKKNRKVLGCRQHYLTFDAEITWSQMAKAGFAYDSTVGFANHSGYRCGTGFPFYPFDMQKKSTIPILEIPLVLMDTTLFLDSKQNLSPDAAWKTVLPYLENTEKNNSCLTINWHNSDLFKSDPTGFSQLYEKIIHWAHERDAWITSPDNVYQWWTR